MSLTTGQATFIGNTTSGAIVSALDYQNGTLYGATTDGNLISIDTATGQGNFIAPLDPALQGTVFGLAPGPNVVPEPGTFALASLSVIGAAIHWRRLRKQRLRVGSKGAC